MQYKSNEYYLGIIREAAERLGRTPGVKDIHSYTSIRVRFGSWPAALKAAGYEHVPRRMPDDDLIAALVAKAEAIGRTPTQADINSDPEMPNHTTYYRAFGTLRKAYAAAGLDSSHLQVPPRTYASQLDSHLHRTYGIREADYWTMHRAQGGVCAICSQPESKISNMNGKVIRLCVDHCHASGAVRALLCADCNLLLGRASDDPDRLRRMADYLDKY